jgi:hypothetical protein
MNFKGNARYFTNSELLYLHKQNKLNFDYFQYMSRKELYIESVYLGIIIPVFYYEKEGFGSPMSIISGSNEIATILGYMNNNWRMGDLLYAPELKLKKFEELEPRYQRVIQDRPVLGINPIDVEKYGIKERLEQFYSRRGSQIIE